MNKNKRINTHKKPGKTPGFFNFSGRFLLVFHDE